MSSDAQIRANRANAQLSSGPTTPAGKAKSSLNAVKTGLTGRTVLLPSDDADAYQKHVQSFFDKHKSVGDEEQNLVQSLADTEWRLLRIPALEMGIYALGRLEFADQFPNEDEAVRKQLIEAKIFLTYRRDLNNLSIQEARLRRQREKDLAVLNDLQKERQRKTGIQISKAVELYQVMQSEGKPFDPAEFGFEFSMQQIRQHIACHDLLKQGYSYSVAEILSRKAA